MRCQRGLKLLEVFCNNHSVTGSMETFGSYEWKITDKSLIKRMINSKNGQSFESQIFNIASLSWRLRLYPNGWSKANIGDFNVGLTLVKMPKSWNEIAVTRSIHIPNTHTKVVSFTKFTKNGHTVGCSFYSLSLSEIINMNFDLSFCVKIKFISFSIL